MPELLAIGAVAFVAFLIAWGNLDGGPWSDYAAGLRRFWRGA